MSSVTSANNFQDQREQNHYVVQELDHHAIICDRIFEDGLETAFWKVRITPLRSPHP
jgi:hypothetical protein